MHVVVIGTGYVGLVTGACLAELGCVVTCVDKDISKIDKLKQGVIPIYEPGLQEIVVKNSKNNRLTFSDNVTAEIAIADAIFLAVGTPSSGDKGDADLSYIFAAAEEITKAITKDCVIITKSTVPVGTGAKIKKIITKNCRANLEVNVVSNPEFLREGSAVNDFLYPDRIIIGAESKKAREIMRKLYWNLIDRNVQILFTDIATSELTKYSSNAYLAMRLAYINEMADLCEKVGADIDMVAKGMGLDHRIGEKYLKSGPGFGGSCFPKDTKALSFVAHQAGSPSLLVDSVIKSNDLRKQAMAQKIINAAGGDVTGKNIAILGLAFKSNTDDMRDSASIDIINILLKNGANIKTYDPAATLQAQKFLPKNKIIWCDKAEQATNNADITVIVTEWQEFAELDLQKLQDEMKGNILVDLRNLYNPQDVEQFGIKYISVGRK